MSYLEKLSDIISVIWAERLEKNRRFYKASLAAIHIQESGYRLFNHRRGKFEKNALHFFQT